MSFSSTLYRISAELFREIETGSIKPKELVNRSKQFVTFQDSCDAIQFILKKKAQRNMDGLIREIFFPTENRGSVSDEEFDKLVASCNYKEIDRITSSTFYFLPPEKVVAINSFLVALDRLEIRKLYDSAELNAHGIYPALWTDDQDNEKAYNLFQLESDLELLKELFEMACREKDYILTFTG